VGVTSEVANGAAVYHIIGRIDASTCHQLESAIGSAAHGAAWRIIFDLSGVNFISSAGLRVILITARTIAEAGGGLAIFGVQPPVNEVFAISGIGKIIPIASAETEARAKLGA
jgi:anti-anti-sigma factor